VSVPGKGTDGGIVDGGRGDGADAEVISTGGGGFCAGQGALYTVGL